MDVYSSPSMALDTRFPAGMTAYVKTSALQSGALRRLEPQSGSGRIPTQRVGTRGNILCRACLGS